MTRREPVRPQYPAPCYIGGTTTDRDALLSQVGGFSANERQLFHLMCTMWEPEISYKRVLSHADGESAKLSASLPTLMDKLQRAGIGLILTVVYEGERRARAILLTDENSPVFFENLIAEAYQRVAADAERPLPSPASLQEDPGITIPEEVIQRLSMAELVQLSTAASPPENHSVGAIFVEGSGDIFVPYTRAGVLIPAALRKLRAALDNTSLLSAVARLRDSSLNEIKVRIESTEASSWRDVIDTILTRRAALEESAVRIPDGLFTSAEILKAYIHERLEYRKRRQLNDEQRAQLAASVEEAVKGTEGYLMPTPAFRELIRERAPEDDADAEQLRTSIEKRLTGSPAGRRLPRVLVFSDGVVHRDTLYVLLLQRLAYLGELLRKEYIRDMEESLHSSDRDRFLFFVSLESWESDVSQRVLIRDPLVPELLDQPELLAEAVVHIARTRMGLSDPRDLKRQLQILFLPESIAIRPYHQLLSLDLAAIFEVAYARVGVLRQLLLRISGRLEASRRRCTEISEAVTAAGGTVGRSRIVETLATLERGSPDAGTPALIPAAAARGSTASSSARTGDAPGVRRAGTGPRRSKPATQPVKRAYSQQQREAAWKAFEQNLRESSRKPPEK